MKTPKILPWLAHKAGIPEARAGELWADALRYATLKTGWVGTSEFWRVAVERVIRLIELESERQYKPRLSPLVRHQARLGMLPLIILQGLATVGAAVWARFALPKHHAH
jgi:hypothetical protein